MKVMLGMSGGVDSSVAAALLLEQGYEVIGVTMQVLPDTEKTDEGTCCSLASVEDARKVANSLKIPYYVMNFKEVFKEKVIDNFIEEYKCGRTPNPCIVCNKYLKFDVLLKKAVSMGIDYIATGHYAKIEYSDDKKRYLLKKSATSKKDQTYVLYNFTQEQLSRTLMPIGSYTKEHIREIARNLGFGVASKPDSQEICFIPDNDYGRFISENTKISSGNFVDINGNILGRHKGIPFYTIGQRKGLGITFGKPMFVANIDAKTNNIVLSEEKDIFSSELIAHDVNFISIERLDEPIRVSAKIRYSAKEASATVYPYEKTKVKVVFDQPQRAITPGQSVVFYDGDVVVGGGVIDYSITY